MRILYVSGYNRMVLFNKLIPKALRKNGHRVAEFDWNSVLSWNKVFNFFSGEKIKRVRGERLLKAIESVKPELIFVLKGEGLDFETLGRIQKDYSVPMCNWFGDDPWEFPVFSGPASKYYTHFFTYDPFSVKLYRDAGHQNAFHLPYGYDTETTASVELTSQDKEKYGCEISFVGTHYPEREEWLARLAENYSIKIWGRGWNNTSLKHLYQGSALYGYDMLKALKAAKVVLNLHKDFDKGPEHSGNGLNLRVMEAAACGACQVSNFQEDIPNRFENGSEIILFNTYEELTDRLNYLLSSESARQEIGRGAFNRVKREHTLEHRMAELTEKIKTR